MSCKYASCDVNGDGRYICFSSGSECIYLTPDSNRCAEEFGEGPDADTNKCEDCKDFYLEDGKRCCKNEPLTFIDGEFVKSKLIDPEIVCCGGFTNAIFIKEKYIVGICSKCGMTNILKEKYSDGKSCVICGEYIAKKGFIELEDIDKMYDRYILAFDNKAKGAKQ